MEPQRNTNRVCAAPWFTSRSHVQLLPNLSYYDYGLKSQEIFINGQGVSVSVSVSLAILAPSIHIYHLVTIRLQLQNELPIVCSPMLGTSDCIAVWPPLIDNALSSPQRSGNRAVPSFKSQLSSKGYILTCSSTQRCWKCSEVGT